MDADDDEIEQKYHELCLTVNMDKPTMEMAWKSYEVAKTNYTLEGDGLHWLVCALYAACRRNLPLMKSVSGQLLSSNCVTLTMLLRAANFSFISFLKKMEKWLDMSRSNSVGLLADHVSALEKGFRVSTLIFKKFSLAFNYVFLNPDDPKYQTTIRGSSKNPSRPHRSRRHLRRQCTPKEIFNFCWTLFIHAKGTGFRSVSDELISSFQYLLGAVDLCYKNALACGHRASLLNPSFPGLPQEWEQNGANLLSADDDIIALLVKQANLQLTQDETDDLLLQARVRNTHDWKTFLRSLLDQEILSGTETSLLVPDNFDANSKAINKVYEEYVLTEGDFDERVFLCDDADVKLGTPIKRQLMESRNEQLKKDILDHLASNKETAPKTPLTNRHYLEERSDEDSTTTTPISTAYRAVGKLKKILQGCKPEPSNALKKIFKDCQSNVEEPIKARVGKLGNIFKKAYAKSYGDIPSSTPVIAQSRVILSTTLYYHALEGTLLQEKKRLKQPSCDLSGLLKRDDFHKLLFACCVEIVLCSFDSPRVFPWILDVFDLSPYYFYKVIELVVRAEENLSGNCVKHMNHIEEQILESLAWKSDSPLWDSLEDSEMPSCTEVNHAQQIESNGDSSLPAKAPLAHPRLKAVVDGDMGIRKNDLGSAQDRFNSPAPGSAKRRLFKVKEEVVDKEKLPEPQSEAESSRADGDLEARSKPKKVGSLALFCRKVYHLASVRLRHLCGHLAISMELRSKVWTCFEHSIAKWGHDLIRDRHIDQLLMCAVYIMARVTQHEQSFHEIMRCYRNQPQATSTVYRSVLIERSVSPEPIPSKPTLRSSGAVSTRSPTPPARSPEIRDHLIQFYNKVYVPKMKSFVAKFYPNSSQSLEVPISPMPRPRTTPQSPRRVPAHSNVYVSPLKPRSHLSASPSRMEYSFQRSPRANLRDINLMVRRHAPSVSTKRHLAFNKDAEQSALPKRLELAPNGTNGNQS